MMARFQMDRKRKMRNTSAFALHDSDSEQKEHDDMPFLMHKGAKIINDDYEWEDDSEEGRKMHRDIVSKLHFVGGKGDADAPEIEEGDDIQKSDAERNENSQEDATDKWAEGFEVRRGLLEFANGKGVLPESMDGLTKRRGNFFLKPR
ncbi:hypothetical protein KXD40_002967 [Peronospora effusa]|nr:hypothetical protein KXD40_002967 [Peronospora effusa]